MTGHELATQHAAGAGFTLVMKTVGADGKESSVQTTYQLDGKDYPITGAADYDSLSGKQVNPRTASFTLKKAGKTVGTTTRTVSKDGHATRIVAARSRSAPLYLANIM